MRYSAFGRSVLFKDCRHCAVLIKYSKTTFITNKDEGTEKGNYHRYLVYFWKCKIDRCDKQMENCNNNNKSERVGRRRNRLPFFLRSLLIQFNSGLGVALNSANRCDVCRPTERPTGRDSRVLTRRAYTQEKGTFSF